MKMKKRTVILTLLTLSLFSIAFNASSPTYAAILQRVWLQYDDGTHENIEAWPAGYMLGVRFTAPQRSILLRLRFYIVSSPTTFEVHILDAVTHADLIEPFTITPTSEFTDGWLEKKLVPQRVFLLVQGDFIVALKFVSSNAPVLGSDVEGLDGGRSEIYDGNVWYAYPSNFMIRAEIGYI